MDYKTVTITTDKKLDEESSEQIVYFIEKGEKIKVTRKLFERDKFVLSINMKMKKKEFPLDEEYKETLLNLLKEIEERTKKESTGK